jgi:hypothetical protein
MSMDSSLWNGRRRGRWIRVLLLILVAAGVPVATAAPAAAAPGEAMQKCRTDLPFEQSGSWPVTSRTRLVTLMGNLSPGSVIRVTATGQVHNGSWFGQWRGPDGSPDDPAPDASWPAPGVNKFALYGRWMRSGSWFRAGRDSGCLDYTSAWSQGNGASDLAVGVNDDVLDDNDGSFQVTVRVWTNSSEVYDNGFERQGTAALKAPWTGEGTGFKGVDVNRRLAHAGRNNAFIRTAGTGWNAVTQRISVVPNRRYRMTAWVRTSGNFTSGVFGVRPVNSGTPWRSDTYGAFAPSPYQQIQLDFDSGPRGELSLFIGYWAPAYDSWVQIDDVSAWAL